MFGQAGFIRQWPRWLAAGLLVAALAGCSLFGGGAEESPEEEVVPLTEQPAATPTVLPTALPAAPVPSVTPLPPPTAAGEEGQAQDQGGGGEQDSPLVPSGPNAPRYGAVIYETDFSTGWDDQVLEGFGTMKAVDGGYEIHTTYQGLWMNTTLLSLSEFYAEVTAYPTQCPKKQAFYGMVFHYRDASHLRFFVVTCSGLYAVFEREVTNRAVTLAKGDLPGGIDPSGGTHRLGMRASKNLLAFYVDDYEVANIGVPTMPDGDIGPYVETTGAPATVLFSRLAVYQPK